MSSTPMCLICQDIFTTLDSNGNADPTKSNGPFKLNNCNHSFHYKCLKDQESCSTKCPNPDCGKAFNLNYVKPNMQLNLELANQKFRIKFILPNGNKLEEILNGSETLLSIFVKIELHVKPYYQKEQLQIHYQEKIYDVISSEKLKLIELSPEQGSEMRVTLNGQALQVFIQTMDSRDPKTIQVYPSMLMPLFVNLCVISTNGTEKALYQVNTKQFSVEVMKTPQYQNMTILQYGITANCKILMTIKSLGGMTY